jgi:peptide/nickel transport system substrate-binding protein
MKKLCVILVITVLFITMMSTGCGSAAPTTTAPLTQPPVQTATQAPAPTATAPSATAPSRAPITTQPTTQAPTTPKTTPASTSAAQYGGTLRYAMSSAPGTPIGWIPETVGPSLGTISTCLQTLLVELTTGGLSPQLAESYAVDNSVPSVTFKLRKGVKFHDGSDFNAQAVKWAFEQTRSGTANRSVTMYWKSIDVVDDYTLRIVFSEWQNRLIRGFSDGATFLCSPAAYEKNGIDWIRWHMVGTGAFAQTSFDRDVQTTLLKFPDYWDKGKPYLDKLQLLYVVDELTRLALFKSGGAELMDIGSNYKTAGDLLSQGFQIIKKQGGANSLFPDSLNADSPWSKIKVRMAAEYALDKESMARAFGFGYLTPAYQQCSPANEAYDPSFTAIRKYDVARAKQLMSEAGYPNGFKTRIVSQITGSRDFQTAIQAYLKVIGIDADLEFVDAAKFAQYQTGTWQNALIFGSVVEYPNFNASLNFGFAETPMWYKSLKKPDGFSALFKASMGTASPDAALIRKCNEAIYNDASVINLYYGASVYGAIVNLHDTGFDTRSSVYWNPQFTWLSP